MMASSTVDKYDVLWHSNMIQVLADYIKRLPVALEQTVFIIDSDRD